MRVEAWSMMSPFRFVFSTLAVTLFIATATVAANVAIDYYGVFGSAKGRPIALHFNERFEKNCSRASMCPKTSMRC
jgi:hypothetical protein